MENVLFNKDLHLDIAEITLPDNSKMVGRTLAESGIKEEYESIIIAIKRKETFVHNPGAGERLLPGDILILLGHRQQLIDLAEAVQ